MKNKIATIIGGSGFIGRHIARSLMKAGYLVKIICRDPEKAKELKTAGDVGQLHIKKIDITSIESLKNEIEGSEIVINLVGILFEKGKQNFYNIHSNLPRLIAKITNKLEVKTFIHFSALGIDKAPCSKYAKTKLDGEKEALKENPNTIIIRPSLVCGSDDHFVNDLVRTVRKLPLFLKIAPKTKFQPVYVGDITKALNIIIESSEKFYGKIFELGGSEIFSFGHIINLIFERFHIKKYQIDIGNTLNFIAAYMFEFLPKPPLTMDQIRLLKYPNIVSKNPSILTFDTLNINPRSFREILNDYKD